MNIILKNKKILIFAITFFVLGIVFNRVVFLETKVSNDNESVSTKEVRLGGYKFINPLLECEFSEGVGGREFSSLEGQVKQLIQKRIDDGVITHAAAYYRELKSGPWIGINEKDNFSPSSLLKLPVMMAYYKLAESNPDLLSRPLEFKADRVVLEQDIKPTEMMSVGKKYSVDEVIQRMMIYSDNDALALLEENIDNSLIDRITLDLGIETPNNNTPIDFMSVKSYASLFRMLFNASYLNKEMSEKALEVLSKVKFQDGIVAGVPSGITVSHKFGERELPGSIRQLHDCGIIYYPNHPYLICVMTRGNDFNNLSKTIKEISEMTYREMNVRYKKN